MAKAQTAAPTKAGLTIARNGNKVVLTWTPVKNCTDQDIIVYVNDKMVGKVRDLTPTTKKYTYTIDRSNFFPNKTGTKYKPLLTEVAFKLSQTQKKKTQSKFSEQKEFKFYAPYTPKYVAPAMDNTNNNVFTYSWARNSNDGDLSTSHRPFTRYFWQTCLVPAGTAPKWGLAKTQKITTVDPTTGTPHANQNSYGYLTYSTSTEVIISEREEDIAARKDRYFRVRTVGPGGVSPFRQSSHHLGGYKYPTNIVKTNTNLISSDSRGTKGTITFTLGAGYANDSIEVQYGITTPTVVVTQDSSSDTIKSSLKIPDDFSGWTSLDKFQGTGKNGNNTSDTYTFNIPEKITKNTMLFMRINLIHDNVVTYGYAALMNNRIKDKKSSTVIGSLTSPTLDSVSVDYSNKTVSITATDTSEIDGSFLAVYQRVDKTDTVIGIIPYGSSSGTFQGNWDDDQTPYFGIKCFVADYSPINRAASGPTIYNVGTNVLMESSGIVWQESIISEAPTITSLVKYDNTTAYISWDWTWDEANSAEISWSESKIAWDSNNEPSSYMLVNNGNGYRYITGLSAGTYYFRVRFIQDNGDSIVYGRYSDTAELVMSSAPTTPTVTLSDEDGIVSITDQVTAYWKYSSNDGTPQSYAQLGEATRENEDSPWTYTPIENKSTNTDTHISFTPEELGWLDGTTHYICVRLTSASGEQSEGWSNPVSVTVAEKPVISISGIGSDGDAISPVNDPDLPYLYELTRLPLDFTVNGFGGEGYCNVVVERASTYEISRPDDTHVTGFNGETIISKRFSPDDDADGYTNVSVDVDDLLGRLDNTAQYNLIVTITDKYGQTDKAEFPFTVMWDHFAQIPSAVISIDKDNDIAIITPNAPQEIETGDYCQLYRMSADKPQLILDHGEFGETYVDIYPTFGEFGGYRIVYVTKYGDYKTVDNLIAMTEYSINGNDEEIARYDKFLVSIRFDNNVVEFPGNISLSHSWAKDFQTTTYLGGSVQGDWNPSVVRSGTINGTIPIGYESETLYGLHLLADYPGICHVRTPDGSNFYGDIQVKDDREEKWVNKLSKISLNYTKVDAVEDGVMTYSDWQDEQEV